MSRVTDTTIMAEPDGKTRPVRIGLEALEVAKVAAAFKGVSVVQYVTRIVREAADRDIEEWYQALRRGFEDADAEAAASEGDGVGESLLNDQPYYRSKEMKKFAMMLAAMFALAAVAPDVLAGGKGGGRSGGSRSSSSRSHSSGPSSRGYYRGPARPSGSYSGGKGSSHKGGSYRNAPTGNHYQKRK